MAVKLDFSSILGEQEIEGLFGGVDEPASQEENAESGNGKPEEKLINEQETTEVVSSEDLFGGDIEEGEMQPESVGSEKNKEEKGDAATEEGSDTSPNFYSSIANALAVDGIFPNSDEEAVGKVDSAESFSELIEAEINARLDDRQKRISKALENGVEPTEIRQYEGVLQQIANITDAQLGEESESGERLRRDLIFQDYINKGYTTEKANKLTQRTFDAGTDIEDAKDALQSNREFFQNKYNKLLNEAQKEADKVRAERERQEASLKKSLLEDKQLMGDMELSQDVRKKVYDNISRPVYKDPETGQYLTAIQKYERENHSDFMKYVGLFYTMTNGFKDFKGFAKAEVRKEMKKGLRELEQTLNGSRRTADGGLNLIGSRKDDPESFLNGGIKLAL